MFSPETTVKNPNIETGRFEQTVQAQIRLLLKEQSDHGLHCLPFHRYFLQALLHLETEMFSIGRTVTPVGTRRRFNVEAWLKFRRRCFNVDSTLKFPLGTVIHVQ